MGYGDNIMATGFARGAAKRGKRVAFGDGKGIKWDHNSELIFRYNRNIAPPGSEAAADLEWVPFYVGNRIYNKENKAEARWEWNYDFKVIPGEFVFADVELREASKYGDDFVLVEPHVPEWKSCAVNKHWPFERYQQVVDLLLRTGVRVKQFSHSKKTLLRGVKPIPSRDIREAAAALAHAALYVGPEGGLHHAAAAVNTAGVVIFGGFIPPQVTGYSMHSNITGGAIACGSLKPCKHCAKAMDRITVEEVHHAAMKHLIKEAVA